MAFSAGACQGASQAHHGTRRPTRRPRWPRGHSGRRAGRLRARTAWIRSPCLYGNPALAPRRRWGGPAVPVGEHMRQRMHLRCMIHDGVRLGPVEVYTWEGSRIRAMPARRGQGDQPKTSSDRYWPLPLTPWLRHACRGSGDHRSPRERGRKGRGAAAASIMLTSVRCARDPHPALPRKGGGAMCS
jgi:hypothetical protein